MSSAKSTTALERIRQSLYASPEERITLAPEEEAVRARYSFVLTKMIDNPLTSQMELVNILMNEFNIKKTQAYIDLKACGALFGNFRMASQEWSKYLIVETCKAEIARCRRAIEAIEETNTDDKSGKILLKSTHHAIINGYQKIIMDANKILGKYERLDKQDPEKPDWDSVKPGEFEMTPDITKLDEFQGEPLSADKKRRIREKYYKDIPEAEEVK